MTVRSWIDVIGGRRAGWILVCLVSATTFVALGTAGRPPSVDLPQHGIILRRFIEGGGDYWHVRWSTPYTGLFLIGRVFALFTDPMHAIWLATSFSIALLPIASAALADSLRRPPALGLFALLGAFSVISAWGFSSLILGASTLAFALAAARSYARRPTAVRAAVLAIAFLATYSAHILAWVVALPATWFVLLMHQRPVRPVLLLPLFASTAATLFTFDVWNSGRVVPKLMQAISSSSVQGPGVLERFTDLPGTGAALGRTGALTWPWFALACVFIICAGVGARHAWRVLRRARGIRGGNRMGFRAWLRRASVACILVASVACFLVVPERMSGTFLVYPRFFLFATLMLPAAVLVRNSRLVGAIAAAATIPCLWLVLEARAEIVFNDERTACIDKLSDNMRPGEALAILTWARHPAGYDIPIDLHLGAELIARRGGALDFDFSDLGASPVTYKPNLERMVVPSIDGMPSRYRHRKHGNEFTAWFLHAPRIPPGKIFGGTHYRAAGCGRMILIWDGTVPPGAKPAVHYMPHAKPADDGL